MIIQLKKSKGFLPSRSSQCGGREKYLRNVFKKVRDLGVHVNQEKEEKVLHLA